MKILFGKILPEIEYRDRPAAYAVITNELRSIAAVKGKQQFFLPGGGSLLNETLEATIHRELREELAREVNIIRKLGEAIQYFSVGEEHYRMHATFYRAEFISAPTGEAEHELFWLAPQAVAGQFFHQCHEWAIGIRDRVDPASH